MDLLGEHVLITGGLGFIGQTSHARTSESYRAFSESYWERTDANA